MVGSGRERWARGRGRGRAAASLLALGIVALLLIPTGAPTRPDSPGASNVPAASGVPAASDAPLVAAGLTVTSALRHDAVRLAPAMAGPLERAALESEIAAKQRTKRVHRAEENGSGPGSKQRDGVPMGLDVSPGRDPVRQTTPPDGASLHAPAWDGLGTRFAGWTGNGTTYAPPDTDGDVGRDRYVQVVSATMVVYDKSTGAAVYGPVSTSALWQGFGGPCELEHADAVVRYDQLADRWLIGRPTVASKSGPYLYCLAVSATGDPAGEWYRYAFEYDFIPDYAKLSVWPDAYYATYNMYDATEAFQGARVCAFERAAMLAGRAAREVCAYPMWGYSSLLAADLDGATPPPAGMPMPVLALGRTSDTLASWTFAVDWSSPTGGSFSEAAAVAVPPYAYPCGTGGACVPQPGTSTLLDTMGDRLMYRLSYRNRGGTGSLLAAHSVGLTDGSGVQQAGVRWYEFAVGSTGRPTLRQSGTFAPDGRSRWLPSIAADGSGAIALGYTLGGRETYPSLAVTGRLPDDAPGTMTRAETVAVPGLGSQTGLSGLAITRWGDYASMTVDPVDDCTFYFTSEYLPSSGVFNWATGITRFRFPSCVPADGSALPDGSLRGAVIAGGGSATNVAPAPSTSLTGLPPSGGLPTLPATTSGDVAGVLCTAPCSDPAGALLTGRVGSIAPTSAGPGATVTITGRDLTGATAVWFNGIRSPRFVVSGSRLLAVVPRGATGTGRVAVTFRAGTAIAPARFVTKAAGVAPRVSAVRPMAAAPGATVTIVGSNLLGTTSVRFGGVPATGIRVRGATRVEVVVPRGARSGPLLLATPGGTVTALARFGIR